MSNDMEAASTGELKMGVSMRRLTSSLGKSRNGGLRERALSEIFSTHGQRFDSMVFAQGESSTTPIPSLGLE